ncbi:MAG: PH domain-containing protein [Bacteroidia bacterium]|nr:PH domain-containing protein [Bacteroidia bacterium]
MKQYTASRISKGNTTFPAKLIIDDNGVTLQLPSWFNNQEKTIPFSRISSVNIECPFIGYSTIIIETTGEGKIAVHGFLKAEVTEMKKDILQKIG